MSKDKIKVLVVDDSLLFRELLKEGLAQQTDFRVVGAAADPYEARDKILALRPDVVTLDVEMPRMDGIKFLRTLMPQYPVPVVVITFLDASVFEALDAGAVDFVVKPAGQGMEEGFLADVAQKVRIAAQVTFAYRRSRPEQRITLTPLGLGGPADPRKVVAIGASTGGTEAIHSMLSKFSADMPGMVICQHMPAGFTKLYADRLNATCALEVKEAEDGDALFPGRVLLAPGGLQMRLMRGAGGEYRVRCIEGPRVSGHAPSVDVLFESVAQTAGKDAVGVILTGMGTDGSVGLKKIREAGGYTLGQDEKSSVVYGMPMAAYLSGAVMQQLPLYRLPDELIRVLKR
ncbi:MAG: chemotaxis response regulator protein-glutamate methylesterase [Clostridiales Family XIII bacterium]|jgi:two-component system chemotaxis response regulator CheB|nr:chemotaxis response regulator protein-glutamate methylesterase [Clostridiales Family XIII bacterium]